MLRRQPSLTEQTKAVLKQRILANEFADDRIPSEADLAAELGVSRTTIRDALSRLENEGVIFRRQGAGTFVNRPGLQIKSRLEEIWSYETVLREHGYTPSTRILTAELRPAAPEVAAELNLAAGDEVLVVEKLFLEDDEPVILARNHIPAHLVARPFAADDFHAPIYQWLAEHAQQHLLFYFSEIVPLVATGELARVLHVPAGSALISFQETGYNEENEPIVMAYSYFRDELLRLRIMRRQAL